MEHQARLAIVVLLGKRYYRPKKKTVDVDLISAVRRMFKENILRKSNPKITKEQQQQGRELAATETLSRVAFEEAIHHAEHSSKPQTVPSSVPVLTNTLNMLPKHTETDSSSRKGHKRVHAASRFKMSQKKLFVPPPMEEFVRNGEDGGNIYAVEKELQQSARRDTEQNVDKSEEGGSNSTMTKSRFDKTRNSEVLKSDSWTDNSVEFPKLATSRSLLPLLGQRSGRPAKAKTFIASTAALKKMALPQVNVADEDGDLIVPFNEKQSKQSSLGTQYKKEDNILELMNRHEEGIMNSERIGRAKIINNKEEKKNRTQESRQNAQEEKIKENETFSDTAVESVDNEAGERIFANGPFTRNPNMRIVAAGQRLYKLEGSPRYLSILNGEVELPAIQISDRGGNRKEKAAVRNKVRFCDFYFQI
ncbi:hypothetical protein OESDEN_10568 [Oesophagostomum dentatum]|uniref:Uncharacterized protein n=1 Tax=Oesophagostomum dentatum TaxID=61180 RepID=A0A0B1SXC3_OESDE|nr:hypothetical protein OESDEN_10568 [Oesophagostomum dentatum]